MAEGWAAGCDLNDVKGIFGLVLLLVESVLVLREGGGWEPAMAYRSAVVDSASGIECGVKRGARDGGRVGSMLAAERRLGT